ncbi:tyrosine-type recombinase/integrase [Pseudomonas lundensis]|uniref:tyrosine-type recombinase/integrase n=1 Tax=Pseudomonas lundensis TaxID=86185 RepID=UPI0040463AD0
MLTLSCGFGLPDPLPAQGEKARADSGQGSLDLGHSQLSEQQVQQARDAAHAYDHIPATERPTFHEIRTLGAWLYEQQNFPQEYIQALMGHADAKMTKHYQDGHTEKGIEYLEVGADLAF